MLAHLEHGGVLAFELDGGEEVLAADTDTLGDGDGAFLFATEEALGLLEYPGVAYCPAAYKDAVDAVALAGFDGLLGGDDVAVAEDGDVHARVVLNLADEGPVGGALIHLGLGAATAMLTTPQPITQAEVLPASPEKVILREHTRPLLAENTAPAQVQEPAATNAMAETAPSTVQDLVVRETAISEDDKKAAPMPTMIETNRLVTIGATRPEAVPVIIEGNNLVMLSDEKPEYRTPRFEEVPTEPERPTFHDCVIEPLLASII